MAYVLIGFMGAGKSTAARDLARALGTSHRDSDELLEARFGHSVAREFELAGEESFRAAEAELVGELLSSSGHDEVLALGGGSVLSPQVASALSGHVTLLLDVSPGTAWERVNANGAAEERPLARDERAFLALHAQRAPVYENLADAILPELPAGAISTLALPAIRALGAAPRGTRMLLATADGGSYPVLVRRGLLAAIGAQAPGGEDAWPLDRASSRPFLVSDETVLAFHGDALGALAGTIAIPPGETNKTLAQAELVWQALVDAGTTRADHVVALGGGVVGDLAGFCAATYQRGIPVVQVPTTLLAQVDSAYGGKTGVDLPQAKNYVGAYHQPAGVIVDPGMLDTLPRAELAAGWVEVLKTALIAGGALWEKVERDQPVDEETIFACARTKLAVVAADERDAGLRQVLNLGHTVGHAIETVTGYSRLRHGEAVGLGLLAALRLSGLADLRGRVLELLQAHGLPVGLDGLEPQEVADTLWRDKKRTGDKVPFVLVNGPGDVRFGCEVPSADVLAAVAELAR